MTTSRFSLQLISLFLILSFFTHQLGKAIILTDYYTNTSKYAKNCINKSKPKMNCNGKCQMMKKIQEEEKKEKQDAEKKDENKKDTPTTLVTYEKSTIKITFQLSNKIIKGSTSDSSPINRSYSIFHPPRV